MVGWECANSGLVEGGPWPLVTWQEFLARGEGGIAYSPRYRSVQERNGGTQASALPGDALVVDIWGQALAATPSFSPTHPSLVTGSRDGFGVHVCRPLAGAPPGRMGEGGAASGHGPRAASGSR